MIENEQDQQDREGTKSFYKDVEISWADWEVVKSLNDTLCEFYFITKKFEGNTPSASLMISEYQNIKLFITKKKTGSEPKMQSMFTKMLAKTNTYLDEALQCNAILIATALHPSFRLSIFQKCFPTYHNYTHDLLKDLYNSRKTESSLTSTQSQPTPPSESENKDERSHCALAEVDYFPDTVEVSSDNEISIYLGGKHKLPTSQANISFKVV
ncbi:hypothetical protein PCASD_23934 [Puccinia coronata f. sp. avenae]|uniref:hAT-like transposase RNase-H fold domain-containing protein n=1 Tax=Puccinia coronata f. sp. avenae TaxID=200324 RepID=A0A2N5S9W0_9BASI|nr:hypothetical protein PCASD_23934 [Puccinia coronata f. sp. avenae]